MMMQRSITQRMEHALSVAVAALSGSLAIAIFAILLSTALMPSVAHAKSNSEAIGEVDTAFKILGPDHKIVVEVYDDPMVKGVACYVSRAKTGGLLGGIGLASDKSDASIACRQVGPIAFNGSIPLQEDVFKKSTSILFKTLKVVRMVDPKRNVLVYLTYSDKLIDGSPKNSVTAVPVESGVRIPIK
jgi:CreA protein